MMKKKLKIAIVGAAAIGLTSAGALAQQANTQANPDNPEMGEQMMQGGRMMANMMEMMNDPEMRRQMMTNCRDMMERMGDMSDMEQPRN